MWGIEYLANTNLPAQGLSVPRQAIRDEDLGTSHPVNAPLCFLILHRQTACEGQISTGFRISLPPLCRGFCKSRQGGWGTQIGVSRASGNSRHAVVKPARDVRLAWTVGRTRDCTRQQMRSPPFLWPAGWAFKVRGEAVGEDDEGKGGTTSMQNDQTSSKVEGGSQQISKRTMTETRASTNPGRTDHIRALEELSGRGLDLYWVADLHVDDEAGSIGNGPESLPMSANIRQPKLSRSCSRTEFHFAKIAPASARVFAHGKRRSSSR
ncbi:hypothetical protein EDB89DRAFT_1901416 [Lactarius sanguifluus]|nr:hypothetical protein EDB89DRAFT_1901416 [Lactarius sanguifluus]